MKDDLAETENSLAGDEASSEWEERQEQVVAEEVISTINEVFVAVRQHGWMCTQKEGAVTGLRKRRHKHGWTYPRLSTFLWNVPRSSVCFSEFSLHLLVLSQHLCNVVVTGPPLVPGLRSAADAGADRWLSMVTSTIDETFTLLKE